jgi:hypothetical protein
VYPPCPAPREAATGPHHNASEARRGPRRADRAARTS